LSKKQEIAKMGIQHEKDYLGEYELIHEKPMEYTATVHSTHVVLMVISREVSFPKYDIPFNLIYLEILEFSER